MTQDGWRKRLDDAINESGRTARNISLASGLGENYVQQMRTKGKMPGADALIKLCEELGLSVTFLFTGARMTLEEEQMLALFASLDEKQKTNFLELLRSLQPNDAVPG